MKQEIKLIYESKYEDTFHSHNGTHRRIEHTLDGKATLPDLLEAFEQFVKAVGYFPPDNSTLDYIKNDDEKIPT